ncbi:hypothetical protein D3C73_316710 [compost metagenome]
MQAITFAQRLPTGAAAQHVVEGQTALGDAVEQAFAQRWFRCIRVMQEAIQILQLLQVGLARRAPGVGRMGRVFEEDFLDVQHIGRYLIASLAIRRALSADEHHRERHLGQTEDHLVNPARHATAHIRPGAFEQQADVGQRRLFLVTHVQLLTRSAKGGR